MYLTEEFIESSETFAQPSVKAEDPTSMLHNFKVAIGILAGISVIVQLLMHWFVPGM